MADDVWAVSQDLPALLNSFAGIKSDQPSKSKTGGKSDRPATPGKAGKSSKPEPLPNIPKAQVFIAALALRSSSSWACASRSDEASTVQPRLLSCCGQHPKLPTGWLVPVAATAAKKGCCATRRAAQAGHYRGESDTFTLLHCFFSPWASCCTRLPDGLAAVSRTKLFWGNLHNPNLCMQQSNCQSEPECTR